MQQNFYVIAIDGKAASGKSSTAKLLAEKLNLLNVSTGEHYRAISHVMLTNKISPDSESEIELFLKNIHIAPKFSKNKEEISINGETFSEEILRAEEINKCVSIFAKNEQIRSVLRKYQRSLKDVARKNNFSGIVIEGRDMNSVVFPDAEYKYFLQADISNRISRRANEKKIDFIKHRDADDSKHIAIDKSVTIIDTSANSLEKVVEIILQKINN